MQDGTGKVYVVSEDMLEQLLSSAAKIGAEAGLRHYEAQKEERARTWNSRKQKNTKLLLKNYRDFKAAARNAVYSASQLDDADLTDADILDLMIGHDRMEQEVESIKRSAARTALIVKHIDSCLDVCEKLCASGKPEEYRNFKMMKAFYTSSERPRIEELADQEGIEASTAYGAIDAATKKLGNLIFGIDGTRFV